MTKLTYRGCQYYKEVEAKTNLQWWNLSHRPTLWLTYRGQEYRPVQTGGVCSPDFASSSVF